MGGAGHGEVRVWRPEGFEGLEVEKLDLPPSLLSRRYYHHGYELTVALQGGARIRYAGSRYVFPPVKAPLLIVANPGEVNEDEGLDGPNSKAWALRVAPDLMQQVVSEMAGAPAPEVFFPSFVVDEPHRARLSALMCQTVASFDEPVSQLECESQLLSLLNNLIIRCAAAPPTMRSAGRERRATKLVKSHLREHYDADITLSDLSALAGLNKSYLLEVFKRDVGLSPHEYLTCTRVARAKDLLRRGLPIAQVAYAVGFVDQSHLNRIFKKNVLVTPGQYQRDSLRSDKRSWHLGEASE